LASFFAAVIIAVVGLLIYSNTFHVPFVFDDNHALIENWSVRYPESLQLHAPRYLAYLSFALNYQLGGYAVSGYHMVNLAIHLITALLVYLLLRLIFRTPYFMSSTVRGAGVHQLSPMVSLLMPLLGALLFVAHPIQTQAVTYVVQRMTSLSALFYLLTVVLYVQGRIVTEKTGATMARNEDAQGASAVVTGARWKGGLLIGAAVVATVLAMKTKETAFTLPFALILCEIYFFRGQWKRRLLWLLPFLATLPIIPVSVIIASQVAETLEAHVPTAEDGVFAAGNLSRSVYLLTQFRVIVTYLRLLIFPVNQNIDYDYPVYTSFYAAPVFISFLFLTGLFGLAVYLYFRSALSDDLDIKEADSGAQSPGAEERAPTGALLRLVSFGIVWFFLTLAVESSLVPIKDVIAEHRLYLPSIGFLLVVMGSALLLLQNGGSAPAIRSVAVIAAVLVCVLGYATFKRNAVWQDDIRLWKDVIAKSPNKARPYNNLAVAMHAKGQFAESIEVLSRSVELDPDHPHAYNNLALALIMTGRSDEAIPLLKKAIGMDLRFADAYVNLAAAFNQVRQFQQSIQFMERNIGWLDDRAEAHYHLGVAYAFTGRYNAALERMERVRTMGADDLVSDLLRLLNPGGRQ
jgi:tetratricopeptide (TPR) repeat protein